MASFYYVRDKNTGWVWNGMWLGKPDSPPKLYKKATNLRYQFQTGKIKEMTEGGRFTPELVEVTLVEVPKTPTGA